MVACRCRTVTPDTSPCACLADASMFATPDHWSRGRVLPPLVPEWDHSPGLRPVRMAATRRSAPRPELSASSAPWGGGTVGKGLCRAPRGTRAASDSSRLDVSLPRLSVCCVASPGYCPSSPECVCSPRLVTCHLVWTLPGLSLPRAGSVGSSRPCEIPGVAPCDSFTSLAVRSTLPLPSGG